MSATETFVGGSGSVEIRVDFSHPVTSGDVERVVGEVRQHIIDGLTESAISVSEPDSLMAEQPRRTQLYAINHLRCMLADDLRNAGVVEGWTDLETKKLAARLYGSFLDSSLCRPEYRKFYGHYGAQDYRDPFPQGTPGPIPRPKVRLGTEESEPTIPTGYMECVARVDADEEFARNAGYVVA